MPPETADIDVALGAQARNVAQAQDVAIQRSLMLKAIEGRRSIARNAKEINAIIEEGTLESDMLRAGAPLNLKTSTVYVDTTADAYKFWPWKNGGASTPAGARTVHVWTHMTLRLNSDIQRATFDELVEDGVMVIKYGDGKRQDRELPLHLFLSKIGKGQWVGDSQTAAAIAAEHNPGQIGGWFSFDNREPLVVVPGDTSVYMYIKGLSGTIAGSSPNLTVLPFFRGFTARA